MHFELPCLYIPCFHHVFHPNMRFELPWVYIPWKNLMKGNASYRNINKLVTETPTSLPSCFPSKYAFWTSLSIYSLFRLRFLNTFFIKPQQSCLHINSNSMHKLFEGLFLSNWHPYLSIKTEISANKNVFFFWQKS